jgi:hypothetical protein
MGDTMRQKVRLTWCLEHSFNAILVTMDSAWPKTDYINDHLHDFAMRVVEKHEIHQTYLQHARIGGETLPELPPVFPSTPSTPYQLELWWRGSSLPLDYGIVDVTCIKLSLVVRWFESHELHIMIVTIFVLPLWWILCLWDDLWDAKMFMFLMYE